MGRPKREQTDTTAICADRLKLLTDVKRKQLEAEKGRTISDTEFAEDIIGIPQSSFSKMQRDMQTPGPDSIRKFVECFNVSADYLIGVSNIKSRDLEIQDIGRKTNLSDLALKVLMADSYVQSFINALLENSLIFDLSRTYARLLLSLDIYFNDAQTYGYIDKPIAYPMLVDEADSEKDILQEKMKESNMDVIKFCEYLMRDTFDKFTASIVKSAEHTSS